MDNHNLDLADRAAIATTGVGSGPDFSQRELTASIRSMRHFPDTGWTLLELSDGTRANGEFDDGELDVGVAYRFFGQWVQHPKYGPQFNVDSAVVATTQTEAGVLNYLTRSGIKLTRGEAAKMWSRYRGEAVRVLRENPAQVVAETGLDAGKAARASDVLVNMAADEPATVELFGLFSGRGFPKGAVRSCVRKWGKDAPRKVRRDPFTMLVAGVKGVGFKRADSLYIDLGHPPKRLKRAMFAGWHWMRNDAGDGDTWHATGKVECAIMRGVGDVDHAAAIRLGVRARWFAERVDANGDRWIAERENASNEQAIAYHVRRIQKYAARWPKLAELDQGLTVHQLTRALPLLSSSIGILCGAPGVGKTFVAAALVRGVLKMDQRPRVKVMAPTGKAAVRISEAMRRYSLPLTATTIHSGLEVSGHDSGKAAFARTETRPLDCELVVIDEASMVDVDLMAAFLRAVPEGASVLFVGDPHQLPPVGHGAPLRDLMAAGVATAQLTEIQRNAGDIVTACHRIKDGFLFEPSARIALDAEPPTNLKHVLAETPETQATTIIDVLAGARDRGFDPVWDCQILCARNEGASVGRAALNIALQAYLNPDQETDAARKNPRFRKGDKVICLKNTSVLCYYQQPMCDPTDMTTYRPGTGQVYVANGDMGRVLATDTTSAVVKFGGPDRWVKVNTSRARKKDDDDDRGGKVDFDLAYAITVHKSQGSEWPVVVVVLDEQGGRICGREHIYTAISRAAKLCFLVGKLPTAFKQVQKVALTKRKTFLSELLKGDQR